MPAAATSTPMARLAPTATITAAASGAARPTTADDSSSVRPGLLVRPGAADHREDGHQRRPGRVPTAPIRQAVSPPTEVSAIGPGDRQERRVRRDARRPAPPVRPASGYSEAIAENVDAATAPMPRIQTSSGIRSRRRFSRINAPVPVSRPRGRRGGRRRAAGDGGGHRGHFAPRGCRGHAMTAGRGGCAWSSVGRVGTWSP